MSAPSGAEPRNTGLRATISRLWRGEMPLGRAFWEYVVVYGLLLNVFATAGALISHSLGAPFLVSAGVFVLPLPYVAFISVSVWRSAGRYPGRRLWADLARTAVLVWAAGAVVI